MNAPTKHSDPVADAWAIVHYALGKFGEDSGREVFSGWLHSLPHIDMAILRETCEELNRRKSASSYITITLGTVKAEYLSRIQPSGGATLPACGQCDNTGVVGVLVAGDGMAEARIVPRNQVAPWAYVVSSTLPCRCHRGQKIADKLRHPPANENRMRYLFDQCVFPTLYAAHAAARECVRQRHDKAEAAAKATSKQRVYA